MDNKKEKLTQQQRAVAARVEARREELGVAHARLADLCGLHRTMAYKKRDMAVAWDAADLEAIAPALQTTVAELQYGRGTFMSDDQQALVAEAIAYAIRYMRSIGLPVEDMEPDDLAAVLTECLIRALKDNSVDRRSIERLFQIARPK